MESPDLTPLVGCIVGQLRFDNQVWFQFSSTDGVYGQRVDAMLVVGGSIEVTTAGVVSLVAEHGDAAKVLPLLHCVVQSVVLGAQDALTLRFTDGQMLHVPPLVHYEAWEIHGHGVQAWIASPK